MLNRSYCLNQWLTQFPVASIFVIGPRCLRENGPRKVDRMLELIAWWHKVAKVAGFYMVYDMEIFITLLVICERNPLINSGFPAQMYEECRAFVCFLLSVWIRCWVGRRFQTQRHSCDVTLIFWYHVWLINYLNPNAMKHLGEKLIHRSYYDDTVHIPGQGNWKSFLVIIQ